MVNIQLQEVLLINTGSFTDDGVYPVDAYLITAGPNSVKFFDQGDNIIWQTY